MIRWRQPFLDALFVATEAIVWFMGFRIFAMLAERAHLQDLERRLSLGVGEGQVGRDAVQEALVVVREASGAPAGPGLLLILVVAGTAFAVMRVVTRAKMEPATAAVVLLAGSVAALNLFLHLAISGDVRIWDVSGFIGFLADPSPHFAQGVDLVAFVRDPDVSGLHGGTMTGVFAGFVAMWLRFVVAARGTVTFERVLRSFTIGFIVALGLVASAALAELGGLARFTVPQFILGALGLAVAHHARAAMTEGERREAAWASALGGTVAMLLGGSVIVGVAVYLNIGAGLEVGGGLALRAFQAVLAVVVIPIFWVLEVIFRFLLPDTVHTNVLERLYEFQLIPEDAERPEGDGLSLPRAVGNGAKFFAVVAFGWVAYRVALLLFGRRGRGREMIEAHSGLGSAEPAGFREILQGILPGRRSAPRAEWANAQPIYRLFLRTLRDADDRGLRRLPGETPSEFGVVAARTLDGPVLTSVGVAFDRARYGRHLPAGDEVARLEGEVAAWEQAVPATPELRERVAGSRHISRDDAFALKIELAKRQDRADAERMGPTLDDF